MNVNTLNFEAKNKAIDPKQFAHIHAESRAMVGSTPMSSVSGEIALLSKTCFWARTG